MFNKLCSFPNLMLAAHKAAKNKRGKASTIDFIFSLESELFALQRTLTARTWKPGGYRTFRIHDPKERTISAAPFRDRVVHHALCNIIEPVFERGFIFDSYANRVGKGSHRAIERFQQYARYCCSCSPDCCCCAFARNPEASGLSLLFQDPPRKTRDGFVRPCFFNSSDDFDSSDEYIVQKKFRLRRR